MWESLGYESELVQSQDSGSPHPPFLAVPMATSLQWAAGPLGLPRTDLWDHGVGLSAACFGLKSNRRERTASFA